MTVEAPTWELQDEVRSLEELLDRNTLLEMCQSLFDVFGVSIRIFSKSGKLLAQMQREHELCAYINTGAKGKKACANVIQATVQKDPDFTPQSQLCFSGAYYHSSAVFYQGEKLGKIVLGPFVPKGKTLVPAPLLEVDDSLDRKRLTLLHATMPQLEESSVERTAHHTRQILEWTLFARHQAKLTHDIHIATVRENYRELERKNVELERAITRREELDQLKSNFLGTISHELRTPLTSILGYSEMLASEMSGPLNAEQATFVETIHTKGNHLLALIGNVLDLNRLDKGRLSVHLQEINVAELIEDVRTSIEPQASKKQLTLKVNIAGNLPTVHADPIHMRRVLVNLADNALKFTPSGGTIVFAAAPVDVDLAADSAEIDGLVLMAAPTRYLQISITDTGVGIAPEELSRVFDEFYQVDSGPTREYGGVGLGLSIVKRLVEAQQGRVVLESAYGKGTTVRVQLPEIMSMP